jgi:pimeloyl-ACP methyl ester carboxylesterase
MWHFREVGSGRPLVLLHGLGMSHTAWTAVTPHLCSSRRVIAFDIAGFGATPPLSGGDLPTVPNLVSGLERSLDEVGIETPVDIVGNSLGGWMALEAARRGIARSVVAIGPAGLWKKHPPHHVKYVLGALRFLAKHAPNLMKATVRRPLLRELAFAVPLSVGSRRMPVDDAVRAVDDLAAASAFEETFESTLAPFTGGRNIAVPVTVAFGDRDWIVTKSSRYRRELPFHTRWIEKAHWGHVPMWIDPLGVTQVILEGTRGAPVRAIPGVSEGCRTELHVR